MTSFARQVRRRQAKSIDGRFKRLNMVVPNFEDIEHYDVPEQKKGKSGIPGHLAKVSPRKLKRSRAKAARKVNRG